MDKLLYLAVLTSLIFSCSPEQAQKEQFNGEESWAFPYFEKVDSLNPILQPEESFVFTDPITRKEVQWEERNVLNPTAVVYNDQVLLFYRAQDSLGTSRIGLAFSEDGLRFKKEPRPVFFPDNDDMKPYEWNYKKDGTEEENSETCYFCYFDGVEDPRIVKHEDGRFFMTYTAYNGKTARLAIASTRDFRTWTKHGLVLKEEKHKDLWSKAGAIVGEQRGSEIVAKKVNGQYWMYYGDTNIFMASSDDLVNWRSAENEESEKRISVLHPRMGKFDSRLVEPGPYALIREEGILLVYNGSNAANFNDPDLPKFTYSAGQALFDKEAPYSLVDRTESYFVTPDKEYERVGEVNEVCFVEGLVFFKDKWYLYYGTADSKIAVAVFDPKS
ncbi:MAG: glycosidase [Saprospiraceae bacterium]|nr:glycosidase [Saprospiraceae bacterium]